MKKTLIVGALALLATLSFATEKLGTQNFAPETLEKIKTFKTISPMSLDKATDMDAGILTGLVHNSGNNDSLAGIFPAFSDLYWATTCSNEYSNLNDWHHNYNNSRANSYKSTILTRLRTQTETNPDAKLAYRAIIVAERIANCGSERDVDNFIELIK